MESQNSIASLSTVAYALVGEFRQVRWMRPTVRSTGFIAEIRCVGATTPLEYRKSIEKDRSLERRFQAVKVPPPNETDAIKILFGIKDRYEKFHAVTYTDDAINFAVSNATFPDRFPSEQGDRSLMKPERA